VGVGGVGADDHHRAGRDLDYSDHGGTDDRGAHHPAAGDHDHPCVHDDQQVHVHDRGRRGRG